MYSRRDFFTAFDVFFLIIIYAILQKLMKNGSAKKKGVWGHSPMGFLGVSLEQVQLRYVNANLHSPILSALPKTFLYNDF
jgi:hypothetical protein